MQPNNRRYIRSLPNLQQKELHEDGFNGFCGKEVTIFGPELRLVA